MSSIESQSTDEDIIDDIQRLDSHRMPQIVSSLDRSLDNESQGWTDSVKKCVDRAMNELKIEMPKEIKDSSLPTQIEQELDTVDHQQFLKDRTRMMIQERHREIEETELRLEQALQELEIVKQSEEKLLQQNVMECKQAYLYSMRQLQEQFAEQAEQLKLNTMAELSQYRLRCESAIEAKTKTLSTLLSPGDASYPSPKIRSIRSLPVSGQRGLTRPIEATTHSDETIDQRIRSTFHHSRSKSRNRNQRRSIRNAINRSSSFDVNSGFDDRSYSKILIGEDGILQDYDRHVLEVFDSDDD